MNCASQDNFPYCLSALLPKSWIDEVLKISGKQGLRERRLPSGRMVWFLIMQALFRDRSRIEVLESLDMALHGCDGQMPTTSAITQAQERLGVAPIEALFYKSAQTWSELELTHQKWKDFSLWVMDGTTLHAADSRENRSTFGAQTYASGATASYPQVRGVSLMTMHSRLIVEVAFGAYNTNEMLYAEELIGRFPDWSVTVMDKGFFSAAILETLKSSGNQRHFIIPAKAKTKWEVLSGKPSDALVRMKVSRQAKKKHPGLPDFWDLRAIPTVLPDGREEILLTSLLDRKKYPTADIACLYGRRWETETCYSEIKETLLGAKLTLRSRKVEGVLQETWGAIIAYNLVRLRMALDAAETVYDPTDLSFTRARNLLRDELLVEACTSRNILRTTLLQRRREQFKNLPNPKRPGRKCPRVVKALPQKYESRVLRKPKF